MKIKNKTALKRLIKNSIGTMDELKIICFFDDGIWQVTDSNTIIPDTFGYRIRSFLIPPLKEFEGKKDLDKLITWKFEKVEIGIKGALEADLKTYQRDLAKIEQMDLYFKQEILKTVKTKIKELEKRIKE